LTAVNRRRLIVDSGLLSLLITGTAFAGRYQQTNDGTTRVWNENPKAGDLVTWSGARDAKGYATGLGTVTWFTPQNEVETGSGVAAWLRHIGRQRHYIVASRESGIMVQGKFEQGPAKAEPKKKGRTDISEEQAPSPRIEATPKKAHPSPAQEKAISPAPTPSRTPANDSLDSLMRVPSSLKLSPPSDASPLPSSPSPTATPDVSVQSAPASSPSPSPK
jgi:hypothetical protein